jgi:hypothetical protein
MTFATAKDPTKRAVTTITTNNTTVKTPNDTRLDHKPKDYKINYND